MHSVHPLCPILTYLATDVWISADTPKADNPPKFEYKKSDSKDNIKNMKAKYIDKLTREECWWVAG